ncbi:hypothetical protein [Anaeromyxobacter dehalogenans]|uniref:hypothetical protein n=1 Tax=Anaeromyxobacter dehalogenans TaxID=161493 RepID=UPI00143A02BB|nr:hypothetical protein [Anaeromyxobacter dehalogenans]
MRIFTAGWEERHDKAALDGQREVVAAAARSSLAWRRRSSPALAKRTEPVMTARLEHHR